MFIGHFAVGFAGKKFAPRTNMALLIAALCISLGAYQSSGFAISFCRREQG
jgi:hypothetical protein